MRGDRRTDARSFTRSIWERGRRLEERQFFNVGVGIGAETILGFLAQKGVRGRGS